MSKTFTYNKKTGHYYNIASDEWEEDGVDFEYEVDDDKLLPEIVDLVFYDYFYDNQDICKTKKAQKAVKETLKRFFDENYLIDTITDLYEDTLKEIFEREALDEYEG